MLLAAIDETHRGTYDFIYLPIDFKVNGALSLSAKTVLTRFYISAYFFD
jgi:hypothetical protein